MIKEIIQAHTAGFILGTVLDLIIGDPHFIPHPIRGMGRLIAFLEKRFLGDDISDKNRDPVLERRYGILLWVIVVTVVVLITLALVIVAYMAGLYYAIAAEAVLTAYSLAARSLYSESMKVKRKLSKDDFAGARYELSMIVGRDTAELDEEEIIKAALETVAENTSDGVIAPLLYTAIGGPVLGMFCKAVNTMDSMIGYRNSRYEHFGSFAARADDVINFIPSRVSAVFMIAGCAVLSVFSKDYSAAGALAVYRRDRKNHSSPNSAQTESVCAGALGQKLGGTHMYKGVPVVKPTIGDDIRKPETDDISRANRLMFMTEAMVLLVIVIVMLLIYMMQKG